MERKLWFKKKRYGWGWYPSSREGWAVMVVYIAFVFFISFRVDRIESTDQILTEFLAPIVLSTFVLILVAWRTGERPMWQWGHEDNHQR